MDAEVHREKWAAFGTAAYQYTTHHAGSFISAPAEERKWFLLMETDYYVDGLIPYNVLWTQAVFHFVNSYFPFNMVKILFFRDIHFSWYVNYSWKRVLKGE